MILDETIWSLTSPRIKRISGSENFRSSPQKDFCNNIGTWLPRTCATARPQLAKADTAFQGGSVGQPTEPCLDCSHRTRSWQLEFEGAGTFVAEIRVPTGRKRRDERHRALILLLASTAAMAEPQRADVQGCERVARLTARSAMGRNTTFYDVGATSDARSPAAAPPSSTTTWVGRPASSEGAGDGHALVDVNTGHAVATLIPRSRLGARWRGRPREGHTPLADLGTARAGRISTLHGPSDGRLDPSLPQPRYPSNTSFPQKRPDASRRLPQDNAGEAGMQEATVAQAYLGTIATSGC